MRPPTPRNEKKLPTTSPPPRQFIDLDAIAELGLWPMGKKSSNVGASCGAFSTLGTQGACVMRSSKSSSILQIIGWDLSPCARWKNN
eukprot:8371568-Pyramimonas_sp.AAC.1